MNRNTLRVAFCGVISALSLAFMLLTSLVPSIGTFALPCISGILLVAIVIEFGEKWALLSYAAVGILSLFLAGDKEAAVYFIAFLGFYPIAKSFIEKLRSTAVQYIIKFVLFNICVISAFFVCKFVLMIPDDEFTIGGFYIPWAFLIAGEVFFLLYDRCISVVVTRYIISLRPKLGFK